MTGVTDSGRRARNEIDRVINRTLVYGLLTLAIAGIYLDSVVLLHTLFRVPAGEQPEIVAVVSTPAIAALFVPLRGRVQRVIDQRFFRHKYDAAMTLAIFGVQARDETYLAALRLNLLDVVQQTVQPAHVSLWLKSAGGRKGGA